MASSSTEVSPEESPPEERRNWLELPRDVTASILTRLGAIKILTSCQMVCKAWLEICWDPLMWRAIDMRIDDGPDLNFDLEKMCRDAVDRSCGELVDINIEHSATDELLRYITDRKFYLVCIIANLCRLIPGTTFQQIKRLRLAYCHEVSDEGLIHAIEKLPLLEELDLQVCSFSTELLNALGRSGPHLKSLKLNEPYIIPDFLPYEGLDVNKDVIAIGKNLPGLCHLQLIGHTMTNIGLEAILDGCPNLESLDLRGNLGKKCAEIKHLRLPTDSLEDHGFVTDPEDGLLDEGNPFCFADADFLFEELL
ncbi:F-box domain containing protein [Trema orientale]|uniref:F-box domain containing protein n=1 Tax=Trema orientale TaxID=63057 RepID=A0A2P5G2B4_TREOI|nr:F-box domain containing protein [Trema orientale]